MGKVLKIGIGAIAGAVFVAATGGLGAGFIGTLATSVGTTAAGAGIGLSAVAAGAITGGLIGGALTALSALTPGKAKLEATGQNLLSGVRAVENPDDYYVFGQTFFPTQLVYIEQHGTEDQSVLWILHHASHRIAQFTEYYNNNELLTFSSGATVGGDYPAGSLYLLNSVGTSSQPALNFSLVDWDGRGRGLAHTGWQMTFNQEKPEITSQNKRVYGQGALNYDPRQDSTRGGSGSQRADDPSTWAYGGSAPTQGSNLALVVLRYIIGERQNGVLRWGIGADLDDIDYAAFIAAANFCDETVNSKYRHHIGGSINCSAPAAEVLESFMAHCGGWCGRGVDGLWTIYIPQNDLASPDWTITTQDMLAHIEINDEPLSSLYNTTVGRCSPKDGLGQLVDFPTVAETDLITADGGRFETSLDLPFVQDFERAQYIARYFIRRNRFDRRVRVTVGFEYFLAKKYQTVKLDAPEFGYAEEVMRIVARTMVPGVGVSLVLQEEAASIYDQTQAVAANPTIGEVLGIDPSTAISVASLNTAAISITGASGDAQDAISVTYTAPSSRVKRTEIQFRKTGATDWIPAATVEGNVSVVPIPGLLAQTDYDVRARHITVFDVHGPWATDTVTTGNNGSLNFDRITGSNKPEDNATKAHESYAFKVNFSSFTFVNSGEIYIHGTQDGAAADVDGFFVWQGTRYTIARNIASGQPTVLTSLGGRKGFVAYHTTQLGFTVSSIACRTAFVWKIGDQWYYDDNNTNAVPFTNDNVILAIGHCETSGGDNILRAAPFPPMTLEQAFETTGDYTLAQPVVSKLNPGTGNAESDFRGSNSAPFSQVAAAGTARNGDSVSFPENLPRVPYILFGSGGQGVGEGNNRIVTAEAVTISGFTMKAVRQTATAGSEVTDSTAGTGGGSNPDFVINKGASSVPFSGTYDFTFEVEGRSTNVQGPFGSSYPIAGFVEVGIYVKRSSAWVQVATEVANFNSTTTETRTVTVTVTPGAIDFGTGEEYGISEIASTSSDFAPAAYGQINSFTNVKYIPGTATDVSLTPTGAPPIQWTAII